MPRVNRSSVAILLLAVNFAIAMVPTAEAQVDVLTQHNDNLRSGTNLNETQLNISNVNNQTFGKLVFRTVDGNVYAQPLIVSGARIASRGRTPTNVAIVATENNSVYAFDADDTNKSSTVAKLWETKGVLGTALNYMDVYRKILNPGESCTDLTTQIGITSTPVIVVTNPTPPKEGIVFVVAKSAAGGGQVYKLFALGLADGKPVGNGATIEGEVAGTGFGAIGSGPSAKIRFDPVVELNRPALLLQTTFFMLPLVALAIGLSAPREPITAGSLLTMSLTRKYQSCSMFSARLRI
jgi:hypothetical protein